MGELVLSAALLQNAFAGAAPKVNKATEGKSTEGQA